MQAAGANLAPSHVDQESTGNEEANATAHAPRFVSLGIGLTDGLPLVHRLASIAGRGGSPERDPLKPDPLKRVELRASEDFLTALDALAEKENLSRADIIRRSVALYARCIVEQESGRYLALTALENGNLNIKELITP
jgi:predicted transcriptional regulator